MTLTLISCELEDDATNKSYQSIQLSIYAAENISSHSVTFHATATGKENQSANCGFVWGIRSKPTIDKDSSIVEINKPGSFSSTIRNLSPETTYYLRAFASNKIETVYSDEVSFTTLNEEAEISFEMIEVVGGTFQMGSNDGFSDEKPVHTVTLSSYYIGKYPVTQKLWQAVMGSDPPELHFKGCNDCPVERISWNDIQQFITKLNQQTDKKYRLPTEAEWEYAASGGNQNKGYIYSGSNIINDVAWYRDNSSNKTHTVGEKQPNELGIYDMSGNVWEWCSDWYGSDYYNISPQNNPTGPTIGSFRVLRGGSWISDATNCRLAHRNYFTPDVCYYYNGFRLALSGDTQSAVSLPSVTTNTISDITETSAISGGNVISDGGANVTERGVCWSTGQNPTINDSKTIDGDGLGSFISSISGLSSSSTYYLRAYATNSVGTAYGEEVSLKTAIDVSLPVVSTTSITNISSNTASSGGNVSADGGASVTSRGICWSTTQNPTINDSKTTNGAGIGDFVSSITGLTANTTYYVRAYATNSVGTAYGAELSFKTQSSPSTINISWSNIPAGTFMMGSSDNEYGEDYYEKPQHQVTLSAFKMSKYQITNAQYSTFLNAKGIGSDGKYLGGRYPDAVLIYESSSKIYRPSIIEEYRYNWGLQYVDGEWKPVNGYDNYPVIFVTWEGADEFARYIGGSLPTEAQWEYACRAGTTSPFYTGNCLSDTQANFSWWNASPCINSSAVPIGKTQVVGSFQPNPWGLYDMHGNVWEWCADWLSEYPSEPQINPVNSKSSHGHVYRGGAFDVGADQCRSACRIQQLTTDGAFSIIGFRVALSQ